MAGFSEPFVGGWVHQRSWLHLFERELSHPDKAVIALDYAIGYCTIGGRIVDSIRAALSALERLWLLEIAESERRWTVRC